MIFHLYDKNILTKESNAFNITHLRAMYGNLSIDLTTNLRWSAHRQQITSNTVTIMSWFSMDLTRQLSTLKTELNIVFSLSLRFLNRQG